MYLYTIINSLGPLFWLEKPPLRLSVLSLKQHEISFMSVSRGLEIPRRVLSWSCEHSTEHSAMVSLRAPSTKQPCKISPPSHSLWALASAWARLLWCPSLWRPPRPGQHQLQGAWWRTWFDWELFGRRCYPPVVYGRGKERGMATLLGTESE